MLPNTTWNNGNLRIVEESVCGKFHYYHCTVCSKDKALYSAGGRIRYNKCVSTSKTKTPLCWCSLRKRLVGTQLVIIIKRLCKILEYTLVSPDSEINSMNSKIYLYDNLTGDCWNTTSVRQFIGKRGVRNPYLQGRPLNHYLSNPDLQRVYPEGSVITEDKENRDNIIVECFDCKSDEYSTGSPDSYTFSVHKRTLIRDKRRGCRCFRKFLTKEQQTERIVNLLTAEGGKFLRWSDLKCSGQLSDPFKWVCKKGHVCETLVGRFIYNNNRCFKCYNLVRSAGGYFPSKRYDKGDNLYVYLFNSEYLKVGRTFNLKKRYYDLTRSSKTKDIILLHCYTGIHHEVFEVEQYIHKVLRDKNLQLCDSWSIELFKKEALPLILDLLNECKLTVKEE